MQEIRYKGLHSKNKRRIVSMAGTRSPVEGFDKYLRNTFSDFKWKLKEAVPLENGWYKVTYLSVSNSAVNDFSVGFSKHIYVIRKNSNGVWETFEEV